MCGGEGNNEKICHEVRGEQKEAKHKLLAIVKKGGIIADTQKTRIRPEKRVTTPVEKTKQQIRSLASTPEIFAMERELA